MNKNLLNLYDVIFYRKGKSYYFIYNNNEFEVNGIHMNNLRLLLKLPFIVKFCGLSKAQIERTITNLIDDGTDFKLYKIKKENSKVLEYAASFYEKKNIVEVYRIPNERVLYGRTYKSNPYMLTKFNNKNVLMEVTKDYFKKNSGDYYFLAEDLADAEKLAFDSYYTKIECEYVYNFSDYKCENKNKNKNKQKIKKR